MNAEETGMRKAEECLRDQLVVTSRSEAWRIDDVVVTPGGGRALDLDRDVRAVASGVWVVVDVPVNGSESQPSHEAPLTKLDARGIPEEAVITCMAPAFVWRIHEIRPDSFRLSAPESSVAFVSRRRAQEWVEKSRRLVQASNWGVVAHPAVAVESDDGARWLCCAATDFAGAGGSLERLRVRRRRWCTIHDLLALMGIDPQRSFGLGSTAWPSATSDEPLVGKKTMFVAQDVFWNDWETRRMSERFRCGVRLVAATANALR